MNIGEYLNTIYTLLDIIDFILLELGGKLLA